MVKFSGDKEKIIFRIGALPDDTAYDYSPRTLRTYLLKEIEMVFYSEDYRYAGQLSLIWSTGIRVKSLASYMGSYYVDHYAKRGLRIFDHNYV
jgi:hypothetical protein